MRRGEVWWYEPPDEQSRPILILTRMDAIGRQSDVIAAPATRTVRGWDTEVELGPDDGMPVECVLSVGNTFLAQKAFLTRYITKLGPDKLAEVCAALDRATDC